MGYCVEVGRSTQRGVKVQISWSDHMVFAYPTYWALPPPLLTLFVDVVVTSGFAFKYHEPILGRVPRWDRRLRRRTATILSTMDSPAIFMEIHDRDPGGKMMSEGRSLGQGLRASTSRFSRVC